MLPYGAVLAGRIFGPWLAGGEASRIRPASGAGQPGGLSPRTRPSWRRAGVAALALAGACQLAALGYGATRPPTANPEQALAGWLADHHLTTGLGTYTEDNVDHAGQRRRGPAAHGLLAAIRPRSAPAVPVVGVLVRPAHRIRELRGQRHRRPSGPTSSPARRSSPWPGPPARTYRFESFTIMVWNKNLLALLAAPPSRLPGDIGHP